ncbi:MAG: segregation/condensation protein A [Burkholderiales bacterium]|uniref:segregation and condensation protein A n=1 Tax=Nitrosomonas sp. TaxID=42353 RepID=UPI001D65C56F|nr:ScpA family protein [Nitrosomonas sp.]MCB1949236.1 segregation/condensation protein A [Nitrosomonas sp.]MCP5241933.1 segregation/condensation protein A [Burkholderiales bacterium]
MISSTGSVVVEPLNHSAQQPIAKICGEPMMEVPQDLYIPPDALEVFLDTFQGPLDLLLYLIRKHNLDILDIPMVPLTQQYMAYVEMMEVEQFELAAEYLLMTALLIEIKSRMLLPASNIEAEEENDPRAELVERLLKYEQIKLAAIRLSELPQAGRDFSTVQVWMDHYVSDQLPDVTVDDLRQVWLSLLARARVNRHHQIVRETLSVRAYMSQVLRGLQQRGQTALYDLFNPVATVAEVIVTFLAVLELAKEMLVIITQPETSGTIYVKPSDTT